MLINIGDELKLYISDEKYNKYYLHSIKNKIPQLLQHTIYVPVGTLNTGGYSQMNTGSTGITHIPYNNSSYNSFPITLINPGVIYQQIIVWNIILFSIIRMNIDNEECFSVITSITDSNILLKVFKSFYDAVVFILTQKELM